MTILIFIGGLLGLMAIGIPISFALILTGVALMVHLDFFDAQLLSQNVVAGADNFPLMAVPFFLLAGELMNAGGISRRIVDLAMTLVGHLRGGLGYVAIGGAVLLASISGSAIADTAALAALLIPMMRSQGYHVGQSAGLIASGGIIAPIIPPSMAFIIYGVATDTSIVKLFMAGIVPGIMMGAVLVLIWTWTARQGVGPVQPRVPAGERLRAVGRAFWALMMPVIIIGGLRLGMFTPTEAAVVAAVYALFVGLFIYGDLRLRHLPAIFVSAAKTTAVVMFLVAAAMFASYMITLADLPGLVINLFDPLLDNPHLLMFGMLVLLTIVGTAMDLTPTILILGPVLSPLAAAAGIDPVYFGVMFVMVCAVGLLTPPVGTVLNVVAGVSNIRLEAAVVGSWRYVVGYTLLLVLFVLVPGLITVPASFLY
jgi:tripartite ATP-independent transporter DctM subunit